MKQDYLNWRQTDPRFNLKEAWPSKKFPLADYHYFRDCGCLICSLAVLLCLCGLENADDESRFNPLILNRRLIDCGAFDTKADLDLSQINKLYPLEYTGAIECSDTSLRFLSETHTPCLITVPGKNAETHFIAFYDLLPGDALVYDPMNGIKTLSSYEKTIDIRVFRATEPTA